MLKCNMIYTSFGHLLPKCSMVYIKMLFFHSCSVSVDQMQEYDDRNY